MVAARSEGNSHVRINDLNTPVKDGCLACTSGTWAVGDEMQRSINVCFVVFVVCLCPQLI